MVTKKQLQERLELHLLNTHGFTSEELNNLYWPARPTVVNATNFASLVEEDEKMRVIIHALLDHLGLEVQTEPATPERVVLVKKAKDKAGK